MTLAAVFYTRSLAVQCCPILCGSYLVQVGQAVGVLAQPLVLASQPVTCCYLAKLLKVHHIQGTANSEKIHMAGSDI